MPTTASVHDRLRAAAFDLFDEQGYDATTVDAIAARAGVGRTTFFRAFASKEDVIFPDHASVLAEIEARLRAASDGASFLAVTEAARLPLRRYLDEGELARRRYRLTSTVPALRAREIATTAQYRRTFRRFIDTWIGDDPLAPLRAELMADAVVTAHNHVLRTWLQGTGDDRSAETAFDVAMAEVRRIFLDSAVAGSDGDGTTVVVMRSGASLTSVLPRLQAALDGPETARRRT
ncbi:AcrR family transcriptional regulator [Mumia flava]|uniref:AcrR family transcriptional regulator n=1 Tax=Mumia flava TaxID=1348852 RepID=A0A0B2BNJ2_9ACTN|nr:TetR/AcrR family transcriptional regulator [Mumia flava]PJJ58518.1 AcrR family transcriptional regulator [Mumia flava]